MAKRKNIKLGPFVKGKDNVQKEYSIKNDSLHEAKNVDISDEGKIERRNGYTQVYSGTDIHSLYEYDDKAYFVEDGTLKRLNQDYTATNLKTGIGGVELDYVTVNGDTYYVGGGIGKIKNDGTWSTWGVPNPNSQPILVASSGTHPAGRYQVAITFVNSDGEESGTGTAALITLTENQKITLSGIQQDSNASWIKVYATPVNGTTLYHQMTIPMGTTSVDLAYLEDGDILRTQFLDNPINGHLVEYYNGRIYVAQDNYLWYSEPYRYGLFDLRDNYIVYPENINFIKALNNGMWVGSDKVYFLRGKDPTDITQREGFGCKPIYNTAIKTESTLFNFENIFGQVIFFWSNMGAMIGTEEGIVIPLSSKRYVPDEYGKGKSFFRQDDGITQIISSLTNKGNTSSLSATDSVSATVIRNGIVIG